jgi:hypothetical protein
VYFLTKRPNFAAITEIGVLFNQKMQGSTKEAYQRSREDYQDEICN